MESTTFEESATILRAGRGDRTAFGELVQAYQRRAYAVAYSFVGNREEALDLAQESFVKAYKAMHRFDTSMPFFPWLYRIVRNTCLNHLKKRRRRGEVSLDAMMAAGHDPGASHANPERDARLADLRDGIARAMGQLTPEHREIVALRHLQDLTYKEIATCLDIPQGTVMSRLHAARRSLRALLKDGAGESRLSL